MFGGGGGTTVVAATRRSTRRRWWRVSRRDRRFASVSGHHDEEFHERRRAKSSANKEGEFQPCTQFPSPKSSRRLQTDQPRPLAPMLQNVERTITELGGIFQQPPRWSTNKARRPSASTKTSKTSSSPHQFRVNS